MVYVISQPADQTFVNIPDNIKTTHLPFILEEH